MKFDFILSPQRLLVRATGQLVSAYSAKNAIINNKYKFNQYENY